MMFDYKLHPSSAPRTACEKYMSMKIMYIRYILLDFTAFIIPNANYVNTIQNI